MNKHHATNGEMHPNDCLRAVTRSVAPPASYVSIKTCKEIIHQDFPRKTEENTP